MARQLHDHGQIASSGIDPFSPAFLADPFPFLAELREAGPVVYLERYRVFAVAGFDEVQRVLRDHEVFSSAAGVGLLDSRRQRPWRRPSNIIEVDPPEHTVNRRVLARALAPPLLLSLQETLEARAEELAERLVRKGTFDAVPDLAEVFPAQVFPEALGITEEGRQHLLAYGALVFNGNGPRNELFEVSLAEADGVIEWIGEHCSRRALRPDGLGARIYDAVDAGEVSEEDAALLVRAFLSAGLNPTVGALSLGILDFVRFSEQWERLREDASLARNAFEEVVRLESPVMGLFRTTTRPVEVSGVAVPADAKVLVSYAGANRDPRRFEDPDRFDIGRRVAGHLGYGTGIHNCVGQVIARMEGEVVLRALAARVASWRLVGPPTPRLNNTLRGLDHLPVSIVPAS